MQRSALFFHGATAPSGPRPLNYRGFTITLKYNILQVSGVIRPSQRPLPENIQQSEQAYIHACAVIRTRNPS
jgi:uncharacterized membrane-anchored protein